MNAVAPEWSDLWREAHRVDMLDVATRLGAKLRRAGHDWVGACVAGCASTDGFVVTPSKGLFLCRPSGETGDVVDMVVHARGLSKAEALEFVTGRDLPTRREESDDERRARAAQRDRLESETQGRREADERALKAKQRRDEEAVADVMRRAVPIQGTHAEAYLRARGMTPPKRMTRDLVFVESLDYFGTEQPGDDKPRHLATLPAMVAIIRNAAGAMIGIHQTFLDPVAPRKWIPPKGNGAKKIRGEAKGGMIRLGMLGDKLVIAEGIETALSAYALGLGPEDASFAAAVSLGNLAGKWTGTNPHPTRRGPNGKPTRVPNGKPDMDAPGVILPDDVREVLIVADSDSERLATQGAILTAGRRWVAQSRLVTVWWAPPGKDANDFLQRQQCGEAAHCEKISAGLVAAHVRRRQTNAS